MTNNVMEVEVHRHSCDVDPITPLLDSGDPVQISNLAPVESRPLAFGSVFGMRWVEDNTTLAEMGVDQPEWVYGVEWEVGDSEEIAERHLWPDRMTKSPKSHRRLWDVHMSRIAETNRILVVDGPSYDTRNREANTVLADIRDAALVSSLCGVLELGDGEWMDWMTTAQPTVVFLQGRTVLASFGLVGGVEYLRWSTAIGDTPIKEPGRLDHWLRDAGVDRR